MLIIFYIQHGIVEICNIVTTSKEDNLLGVDFFDDVANPLGCRIEGLQEDADHITQYKKTKFQQGNATEHRWNNKDRGDKIPQKCNEIRESVTAPCRDFSLMRVIDFESSGIDPQLDCSVCTEFHRLKNQRRTRRCDSYAGLISRLIDLLCEARKRFTLLNVESRRPLRSRDCKLRVMRDPALLSQMKQLSRLLHKNVSNQSCGDTQKSESHEQPGCVRRAW